MTVQDVTETGAAELFSLTYSDLQFVSASRASLVYRTRSSQISQILDQSEAVLISRDAVLANRKKGFSAGEL